MWVCISLFGVMYDAVVCDDHVVCLSVFVHVVDWSDFSANAFVLVVA